MKNPELALRAVIRAWDALPSGRRYYSPLVIGDWLRIDMKPAIDEARKAVCTIEGRCEGKTASKTTRALGASK